MHDVLLAKAKEFGVQTLIRTYIKMYDFDTLSVTLEDDTILKADIIVAADCTPHSM